MAEKESKSESNEEPEEYDDVQPYVLQRWIAVCTWNYGKHLETCAICRMSLQDLCIECQGFGGISESSDCTIAWGACNHAFHVHCISHFLKRYHTCPLDNLEWEYLRIGR